MLLGITSLSFKKLSSFSTLPVLNLLTKSRLVGGGAPSSPCAGDRRPMTADRRRRTSWKPSVSTSGPEEVREGPLLPVRPPPRPDGMERRCPRLCPGLLWSLELDAPSLTRTDRFVAAGFTTSELLF